MGGDWRFSRIANMRLFAVGRAVFAFAASNAFTTLSIFLLSRASFTSSTIFLIFLVRSVFGSVSYLFIDRLFGSNGGLSVKLGTIMRVVLVLLFPVTLLSALAVLHNLRRFAPVPHRDLVVYLFGGLWSESTMLYAQPGSLGVYDALASVGGALGNYSGGLIPTLFGFETLFILSGVLFLVALILFYLSRI